MGSEESLGRCWERLSCPEVHWTSVALATQLGPPMEPKQCLQLTRRIFVSMGSVKM